jgi:hypothetical protein
MDKPKRAITIDGELYYHTDHVSKMIGIAHDQGYKAVKDVEYKSAYKRGYEVCKEDEFKKGYVEGYNACIDCFNIDYEHKIDDNDVSDM